MTANQYIVSILAKYAVFRGPNSPAERLGAVVAGPIRRWAGQQLNALKYSGSYAKHTAVRGISDVDLFISLRSNTVTSLKDIYYSLYELAQRQRWSPRAQNVSVGITVNGTRGDLVPGKVQSEFQNYHSIYLRKQNSWTQTNVSLHVQVVLKSGRLNEIRAMKIWRLLREIDFPSLYLELFTIRALSGRSLNALGDNVLHALRIMGKSLASIRIEDPANSSNVLSDELTVSEKQRIAALAAQTAQEPSWGDIIW
jgi:hypothetical protein